MRVYSVTHFCTQLALSRTGYVKTLTIRAKPECKNVLKSETAAKNTWDALLWMHQLLQNHIKHNEWIIESLWSSRCLQCCSFFPPSLLCLSSDCLHSPPSWSPHMWADNSPPRTWEAAAPGSWSPLWGSPGMRVHAEVTAPRATDGGDADIRHAEWNNPPRRAREGSAVPTAYGPTIPDCPGKYAEGIDGWTWCCCCCFGCSIAGLHHTGSLHSSAQPRRRNSLTPTQHSAMSLFSCF